MRWALRKARRKRPLWRRARRSKLPLVRIMAQEIRLKASRVNRTNLATAPVLEIRSRISPPTKKAEYERNCILVRGYLEEIIDDSRRGLGGTCPKHNSRAGEAGVDLR